LGIFAKKMSQKFWLLAFNNSCNLIDSHEKYLSRNSQL